MGITDHLTYLLRNLYAGQEATVRLGMEQQIDSKLGKVCQGCIFSPCLFNLHSEYTSREMLDWLKHRLELRMPGEISITSDMQMLLLLLPP